MHAAFQEEKSLHFLNRNVKPLPFPPAPQAIYRMSNRVNEKWSNEALLETCSTASLGDPFLHFSVQGNPPPPIFLPADLMLPKWAMQSVFCFLQAPDETTLKELAGTLQEKNIDHMLWLEQPENVATCIALRPYPKEEVSQYLKKFRLFK